MGQTERLSAMKEEVNHKGKVVKMTPQVTTVAILQHGACSECHAAGLCGMSDIAEKAIEVPTDPYASYGVGDEVSVVLKASMGMKAVWLAYVIPLVLMVAALLGTLAAGGSELLAGLVAIAAIALYYGVIWLLRDRLRNEYIFNIKA